MKTLLLTLVVVTIVCLDLGHTLTCLTHKSVVFETSETCLYGQNVCFKRWYPGSRISAGCAVTCPKKFPLEVVECCTTDRCNR